MNKTFLLILFLLVKSAYIPLNRRRSKYYWKIKVIDDKIPLIPVFIIPYLGYFIYIITTIVLLWNSSVINTFFVTYIISYIIAGFFWYFIPNGVKRPVIKGKDIFSKLISLIYKYDDDTNGFPSAHIFATLICSYFLFLIFPQQIILISTITFLIFVSTVFVKQHYVLDIVGGIITFWLSIMIGGLFGKI